MSYDKENDEQAIEYDYQAGLTYYDGLQSFAGLMAGFAFTAIVLVLTSEIEITTFQSQAVMLFLYCLMIICFMAAMEVICIQMRLCAHSLKPIFPKFPDRNRWISKLLTIILILFMLSVPMIFLLSDLIPLFAVTICIFVVVCAWYYMRRFLPVRKEWESTGWF